MKKLAKLFLLFICFFVVSCKFESNKTYNETLAPKDIKERAFHFAELYTQSETEYELGGQSPVRVIKIDCSGLVVMCYKYAIVDTKYNLLEPDMAVDFMFKNASVKTETPERGDLVFMGELGTDRVTHIGIFDKEENGEIYFIDSTDNGIVNGVTLRHYKKGHEKIKGYGVMKLLF